MNLLGFGQAGHTTDLSQTENCNDIDVTLVMPCSRVTGKREEIEVPRKVGVWASSLGVGVGVKTMFAGLQLPESRCINLAVTNNRRSATSRTPKATFDRPS